MDHTKIRTDAEGNLWLNFGQYGQEVEFACFSGDGHRVLTVQEVGTARIRDVDTGDLLGEIRPTSPLEGRQGLGVSTEPFRVFIEAVALNGTGDLALLGLNDGTAGMFSVPDGRRLSVLCDPERPTSDGWEVIRSVGFSPDGSLVAVGFNGRAIGIWATPGDRMVAFLRHSASQRRIDKKAGVRDSRVTSIAISLDNRFAFAGCSDMAAAVWEIGTGALVFDATRQAESVLRVFVDGRRCAWATSGGTVWVSEDGCVPVARVLKEEHWVEIAFAPDGNSLLARTSAGAIRRVSLTGDSETLAEWQGGSWFEAISEDATTLVFGDTNHVLVHPTSPTSLRVRTGGAEMNVDGAPQLRNVLLSPRGDRALISRYVPGAPSAVTTLFDTATQQDLRLPTIEDWSASFAWSPDGSVLAVGMRAGKSDFGPGPRELLVWRVVNPSAPARLNGHRHQIRAVEFLPAGNELVTASLDGTVRYWRLWAGFFGRSHETEVAHFEDLDPNHLCVLDDARVMIFRLSAIEVWERLRRRLFSFSVPVTSVHGERNRQWAVSTDKRWLAVLAGVHVVRVFDLNSGHQVACHQADIDRPAWVPSQSLKGTAEFIAGAYVWQAPGGPYAHPDGDGPRGWTTHLRLSSDGRLVAIPCRSQVVIVTTDEPSQIVARMPFEGRMRASCITGGRVLVLNSKGRVFSAPLGT